MPRSNSNTQPRLMPRTLLMLTAKGGDIPVMLRASGLFKITDISHSGEWRNRYGAQRCTDKTSDRNAGCFPLILVL